MTRNQVSSLILTGLNGLVYLGGTLNAAPASSPAAAPPQMDATPLTLRQASLTSIERSWLEMPRLCKARNAAFDPISVGQEILSPNAADIYARSLAS